MAVSVNVRKVFERVTQNRSLDESSFIMYFNDTINELIGKYRERYVILPAMVYTDIETINDTANVYGVYTQCVAENITYSANFKDEAFIKFRGDFLTHAEEAYRAIYRDLLSHTAVTPLSYHTSDGWWG